MPGRCSATRRGTGCLAATRGGHPGPGTRTPGIAPSLRQARRLVVGGETIVAAGSKALQAALFEEAVRAASRAPSSEHTVCP